MLIIKSCSKVSDLKVPNLLKSKRGKEIDLISIKLIKQHCLSFQNLVAWQDGDRAKRLGITLVRVGQVAVDVGRDFGVLTEPR